MLFRKLMIAAVALVALHSHAHGAAAERANAHAHANANHHSQIHRQSNNHQGQTVQPTQVPELDGSQAAMVLALLAGLVLVLRETRRQSQR